MSETLFSLLDHAASRWGGSCAIRFEGKSLSYAELLAQAVRVGAILERLGAGPGKQIAFCFGKSIDAIVTMFAIIRTGATYVPIDPAWPSDRVKMICEDARLSIWTGTRPPSAGMHEFGAVLVSQPGESGAMSLDEARAAKPMAGPPATPKDDLANILFTSGSTGRPKGVQITALSLLHYSKWVVDYFGLTCEDVVANHAPYNFDLSTLDIFAAVRAGATMCPVPEKLKMFPYQMAKFIADEKITTWYSVPSALIMMQLRGKLGEHDLSRLKHIIFAGEVMPKPALQEIARQVPHATYSNLYGPTETNVCTYHRVTADDLAADTPVPIGVPITDTRIWITEDGELLVAGPTLTTGYFGDSAKTAERLVAAPDGNGVAYRTGDRVTRRADGVLMFEGRLDRMIKCRGYRIEPGEIEAALCRHPAVKEVAVVAIADPVFGNRLKACIASRDGGAISEDSLRQFCQVHLPPYMLPDVWEFHASLPRTDREKIDLVALAGGGRAARA
jgi:amino acid adenylation domain-containing protein